MFFESGHRHSGASVDLGQAHSLRQEGSNLPRCLKDERGWLDRGGGVIFAVRGRGRGLRTGKVPLSRHCCAARRVSYWDSDQTTSEYRLTTVLRCDTIASGVRLVYWIKSSSVGLGMSSSEMALRNQAVVDDIASVFRSTTFEVIV